MFKFLMRKKRTSIGRLNFKQDYHTHLLPGVDDSRLNAAGSRKIIIDMVSRGVEKIYLTPHIIAGTYQNTTDNLTAAFNSFVEEVALPNDVSSRLTLAAEYMVDENFYKLISNADSLKNLLKLSDNRVLIEMSYVQASPQLDEVIFLLTIEGITPVLAHPERYAFYDKHEQYDRLAELGVEFQLNILSATGAYGKESMKSIEYIMKRGYYKYVGTDLHSSNQYRAILSSEIDNKIVNLGVDHGLWSIL